MCPQSQLCFVPSADHREMFPHLFTTLTLQISWQTKFPTRRLYTTPSSHPKEVVASFNDSKKTFESKTFVELLRAWLVFKICSWQFIVKNSESLVRASKKTLGNTITNYLIRQTFFKHFCAGEDEASIRPVVNNLLSRGVGGILDYAAEADLDSTAPEIFLSCISAVHNVTPEGFAAIKITALGDPLILEYVSKVIIHIRSLFSTFDKDGNGVVSFIEFSTACQQLFSEMSPEAVQKTFERFSYQASPDSPKVLDYVEWTDALYLEDLWVMGGHISQEENTSKLDGLKKMLNRIYKIADFAQEQEVRLMIDAEQTYFQPAIDHFVQLLQKRYNRKSPVIFHTYQCYLKDAKKRVQDDLERSRRGKYLFATKIVRGAYMISERERAQSLGYEDPIQPDLEATHQNYNEILDILLENVQSTHLNVLVATHNQQTVEHAIYKMEELNVDRTNGGVYFGQLFGMTDNLTLNLGRSGYKAYKYVPFGPLDEVVPYLIRRANENSTLFGGPNALQERSLLRDELIRRITFR